MKQIDVRNRNFKLAHQTGIWESGRLLPALAPRRPSLYRQLVQFTLSCPSFPNRFSPVSFGRGEGGISRTRWPDFLLLLSSPFPLLSVFFLIVMPGSNFSYFHPSLLLALYWAHREREKKHGCLKRMIENGGVGGCCDTPPGKRQVSFYFTLFLSIRHTILAPLLSL